MKQRDVKIDLFLILLVSLIMTLPQLLGRGMIIGSDSIFHFNRFYDTAMQIKEGNFQYFISMYGFQESGRIVNALYGPLTAYLHGLLVLISNSWYKYQMLTNVLLFLLSGSSMYFFLKKGKIVSQLRLPVSILYMTTYSVHYWTTRQGFSSWGAALLPLCLIPFIEMIMRKKINKFQLGICTALMVQTHLFSSLLLVLIYIPAFIFAYFQTDERKQLLSNLFLAVIIFFALTANIWIGFSVVYSGNEILTPFVNQTMSLNTINSNSYYWLLNPISLVFILFFELIHGIRRGKKYSALHKITLGMGITFLILSTSIIPWSYLVNQGNALAELIQFPFRFFVPCTILFLFSFCMTIQDLCLQKRAIISKYLNLAVVASVIQVLALISFSMYQWHQSDSFIQSGSYTVVQTRDENAVRDSFFMSDLSESLKLVEKPTPDYLPIYSLEEESKYRLYQKEV
ncbi:MAG: hypothetical protein GX031_11970, partial [Candidatus Riflebacteria bacterium]|nr:hypothetical protein [Candidatus Riflebacteria bacterium]